MARTAPLNGATGWTGVSSAAISMSTPGAWGGSLLWILFLLSSATAFSVSRASFPFFSTGFDFSLFLLLISRSLHF